MAKEKITYMDLCKYVKENCELPKEYMEVLDKRIASLSKKNETKTNSNADKLAEKIRELVPTQFPNGASPTDIATYLTKVLNEKITNQNVTSAFTYRLMPNGYAMRYVEKGKPIYKVIA